MKDVKKPCIIKVCGSTTRTEPCKCRQTKSEKKRRLNIMSENYIVINGKRAKLTEEQLKALGIKTETNNKFSRVKREEFFYAIDPDGYVGTVVEYNLPSDKKLFDVANYCTDKSLMEQRALHETLNRLLWRYSMEHKKETSDNKKYMIEVCAGEIDVSWSFKIYTLPGEVYFDTYEVAENAIKEIVDPFMSKHPEFKW